MEDDTAGKKTKNVEMYDAIYGGTTVGVTRSAIHVIRHAVTSPLPSGVMNLLELLCRYGHGLIF
jgi:hypothetical protein